MEKVLAAKKRLDAQRKEIESTEEEDEGTVDVTDKVGEKLKDSMASFMKGFMNVLNMKGNTNKFTAHLLSLTLIRFRLYTSLRYTEQIHRNAFLLCPPVLICRLNVLIDSAYLQR